MGDKTPTAPLLGQLVGGKPACHGKEKQTFPTHVALKSISEISSCQQIAEAAN